ncbi:ABC transporter permease [Ensifer sp. R-19]|uniref:ABC transporter permease n=1 Tax=Ensifer sp. R-19 TaxID=3404055 RepID=UPI003CF8C7E3
MPSAQSQTLAGILRLRVNVILALILRDMRTRFGRSHLGYLIAIGWPLAHLVSIVGVAAFINKVMPLGTDPAIFVATGALPYILCLYPARMIGQAIVSNKPLFLFPIVTVFDVMASRILIEFITAFIVVIIFGSGLYVLGVDIVPLDATVAMSAILATVFFSISVGVLSTVITSIFPFWGIGFVVIMVLLYGFAGVFVLPTSLSQGMRELMWYNPLFHCVEWIRSAYYEGYGDDMLSRSYLLWSAATALLLGLLGERFVRGKLLLS